MRGSAAATSRPARVHLTEALLTLFPDAERRLDVEADTVSAVVGALDARWPGMRDRLCDERPAIRRHIAVFVNGERASLATRLPPDAEVYILTAISDG